MCCSLQDLFGCVIDGHLALHISCGGQDLFGCVIGGCLAQHVLQCTRFIWLGYGWILAQHMSWGAQDFFGCVMDGSLALHMSCGAQNLFGCVVGGRLERHGVLQFTRFIWLCCRWACGTTRCVTVYKIYLAAL